MMRNLQEIQHHHELLWVQEDQQVPVEKLIKMLPRTVTVYKMSLGYVSFVVESKAT